MENEEKNKEIQELQEDHDLKDELKSIGQIIVGELESIGGIITANPIARAEGDMLADEAILREKIVHEVEENEKE